MGPSPRTLTLLALSLLSAAGCKGGSKDAPLSKAALAEETDEKPDVPVPPENGPRLGSSRSEIPVLERPKADAPVIGAVRAGGSVARADKPYKKTKACEGGYYPVAPRGFVCATPDVSLEAKTFVEVDTGKALPFRHGLAKSATPLYARIPTPKEQEDNEPDLFKHLARAAKEKPKSLRAGANDVPLDERGVATGPAVIAKAGDGIGEDGRRTNASHFAFAGAPKEPPASDPSVPLVAAVLRRGSGVAVAATFETEGPGGPRTFGLTADGRYVAIDRLDPALGSTWHGVDITEDKGLPLGFVLRHEVCPYELARGKAKRLEDEEVERRHVVHLTGRFRTVDAVRYEEAEGGVWFREKDLIKVVKRTKFPEFVADGKKWVDISLALQTMTLYEGKKPIYATLVSSGSDMLGDPTTTASTIQGTFNVTRKALSMHLDPRETQQAYDIFDAPWVLEFSPGFAITGSYWSDPGGEARMFHDVALTPIDARRLFQWAGPSVPVGWKWVAPDAGETITIHVRR